MIIYTDLGIFYVKGCSQRYGYNIASICCSIYGVAEKPVTIAHTLYKYQKKFSKIKCFR